MPTHAEKKTLPYTPDQLFDLVADVEHYPEFLPWCLECRITERDGADVFFADLVIGYKIFREKFVSRVHLYPAGDSVIRRNDEAKTPLKSIRVEYIHGPLKHLSNEWNFIQNEDGSCTIDFFVNFEFKNPFFEKVMGVFFNEVVRRMVSAFESRAAAVYG